MRRIATTLASVALLGFFGLATAQEAKLAKSASLPEGQVAPPIRTALDPKGLRITIGDTALAELWLVSTPVLVPPDRQAAGAQFGRIEEGTLVGLVRFPDKWTDYKGTAIAPGIYTLRYAIQPADGAHMGITEYRDFLLLSPARDDPDPEPPSGRPALYELSRKASGTTHPAAMSLVPVPKDAKTPSIVAGASEATTVAAKVGSLVLGIVVEGRAKAEGY